jgi:hypothetical protein
MYQHFHCINYLTARLCCFVKNKVEVLIFYLVMPYVFELHTVENQLFNIGQTGSWEAEHNMPHQLSLMAVSESFD